MGTQKLIAQKIIDANADYILCLKENHPTLHQQVKNWFETAQSQEFKGIDVSISQRVEKGHSRIETRKVFTVSVSQLPLLHEQQQWSNQFWILEPLLSGWGSKIYAEGLLKHPQKSQIKE